MTINECIDELDSKEVDMIINDLAPQIREWLEELKAIKDGAVFYSNRPIEDIVLEARAATINECIEALGNNIWDIAKLEQLKIEELNGEDYEK